VKEVHFYYQRCGAAACSWSPGAAVEMTGSPVSTPPYSFTWTFPSCGTPPDDHFNIAARAIDRCGNVSGYRVNDSLILNGRGCFRGDVSTAAVLSWVSDLQVPDGRGQVVVDGSDAVFPAGGAETFGARVGPGRHRLEAVLVEGSGKPGTWRFDLSALGVLPGSVRVVAGEAALVGPAQITFRLKGHPGERVVFAFAVGGGG
jgi:hypothetical protein